MFCLFSLSLVTFSFEIWVTSHENPRWENSGMLSVHISLFVSSCILVCAIKRNISILFAYYTLLSWCGNVVHSNLLFWFGSCTGFIFSFSLMKVRERLSRIHCKRKGTFHSTVIGWAVDWRMSESRLESLGGSQESMKWIEDPLESNFPTTFKRIFREKDKMSMASTSTGDAKPGGYDKDIYLDDG